MKHVTRYTLMTCGVIALGLGLLGLFVPLLPTTPFLLVASACFLRSSERLHRWLLHHRLFGCYIRDYQAGLGVPMRIKALALAAIWISIPASLGLMSLRLGASPAWLAISATLLSCAAAVSWYLVFRLPTRSDASCPGSPAVSTEESL